jgi:hypothetical protein
MDHNEIIFVFNVVIWVLGDAEMLLAVRLRQNVKVVCYSRLIMEDAVFFLLVRETDWTPLFMYFKFRYKHNYFGETIIIDQLL